MTRYHDRDVVLFLVVVTFALIISLTSVGVKQDPLFKVYDQDQFIVCTVYVEDNAIAQTCERQS